MSKNLNQNYYTRISNQLNKTVYKERSAQSNYLIDQIEFAINKSGKWLDIGCGAGVLGAEIIKRFGILVEGIDLNKASVVKARSFGLKATVSDIEKKWPFANNSFDTVSIVQVMEHVNYTDNLIVEARRVLKKGGILIISTPNLASWYNRFLLLFGYQPFYTEVSVKDKTLGLKFTRVLTLNREPAGHLRVFTMEALVDLLELYDFKIVKKIGGTVNYFPWYISLLDRLMANFNASLASDLILISKK